MARTHVVQSGETLNKIALRYFGSAEKWNEIVKTNPQLSGRRAIFDGSPVIFPGDVLIIENESLLSLVSSEDSERTVVLDENALQDFSLFVDGKKFSGFTGYSLVRSSVGVDAFSFQSVWDSENEDLRAAFKPFCYPSCKAFYEGELIFCGVLLPPVPCVDSSGKVVTVQGYPKCGVLIDSVLPPSLFPAEFSGLSLSEIAKKVCEPFGVAVCVEGDSGAVFEKVEADLSVKVWDFLQKLAEQHSLVMTNRQDGSLLIYKPPVNVVCGAFRQGEAPFLSLSVSFDGQKMFSHITGYTKTTAEKDSAKYTFENMALIKRGVLRCYAEKIDDADASGVELATRGIASRMFSGVVKYRLLVSGHRTASGELYRENMAFLVRSAGAEVFRDTKLIAEEVTLKRDDSTGATTEFSLILAQARSGEMIEEFPWDE